MGGFHTIGSSSEMSIDTSSNPNSDPSEDIMILDNDFEDSSVQILIPPSPPVDLKDSLEVIVISDSHVSVLDLLTLSSDGLDYEEFLTHVPTFVPMMVSL